MFVVMHQFLSFHGCWYRTKRVRVRGVADFLKSLRMLISPSLIFLESWVCNLVEDKKLFASPVGIPLALARKGLHVEEVCIVPSIFSNTFRLPSDVRKA
jgi:hypothetical protein